MAFFKYASDGDEEFFESIPEKSADFMKTVCAFENTAGGTLIFDITGRDVYAALRSLKNDISYCSEPKTTPRYSVVTSGDRTYAAVRIDEGRQKPYRFFWGGQDMGAFVRRNKKTVPAGSVTERELYRLGAEESYDDERDPGSCRVTVLNSQPERIEGDIAAVTEQTVCSIMIVRGGTEAPLKEITVFCLAVSSPFRDTGITVSADKDSVVFTVPGGFAPGEGPEDIENGVFTPKNYGMMKIADEVFAAEGGCAGIFSAVAKAVKEKAAAVETDSSSSNLIIRV